MKNLQRPAARAISDGSTLKVHSIFPTIQGEGPFAGKPALFVRLADCNLQCPWCDTEYTAGAREMPVGELVNMIDQHQPHCIVITGGEPFRQNLRQLLVLLCWDYIVQIETNGMLEPQGLKDIDLILRDNRLHVVVSPKTHRCWSGWDGRASAFKYVVAAGDVAPDGLPIHALGHPIPEGQTVARPGALYCGPVYVQPQDDQDSEKNRANEQEAVRSVLQEPRTRRLCLQIHKMVGLD